MKRVRWIAGFAVLLALIVVGWFAAPRIWLAIAYRRNETSGQLHYYDKRDADLPGEERIVPDQICPFCTSSDRTQKHTCLASNHLAVVRPKDPAAPKPQSTRYVQVGGVKLPADFKCTCPGPHY